MTNVKYNANKKSDVCTKQLTENNYHIKQQTKTTKLKAADLGQAHI